MVKYTAEKVKDDGEDYRMRDLTFSNALKGSGQGFEAFLVGDRITIFTCLESAKRREPVHIILHVYLLPYVISYSLIPS